MRFRLLALLASVSCLASWTALTGPAQGADPTRYVSTSGTDNATCDSAHPCQHIQHAVDVATPGDTIRIAAGTYTEQVLIPKSVKLIGAGVDDTTIKGPLAKNFDSFGKTYIVETSGSGVTVDATRLTVSGPSGLGGGLNCAPNPLSLDMGVAVVNDSTLNMYNAAVRKIYDIDASGNKTSGCQRGDAISVGKPGGATTPTVGHANLASVQVTDYQKDGVAVRTAGSTLNEFFTTVANQPSNVIASNGIEIIDGAAAQIRNNTVTGNECNLAGICGPDPINNTEASGILSFAADPSTVIAGNHVSANDMGIYTDDGIRIANNQDSNNRAVGLYVDTDATKLQAISNTTNNDGYYGIAIGPQFPVSQGGTGKPNPGGNYFVENTAFGNVQYDLWQSSDAGPNHNRDNHCGTAFPSRKYWDCESGDGDEGGDEGGDHGGGGDHRGGGEARYSASALHRVASRH